MLWAQKVLRCLAWKVPVVPVMMRVVLPPYLVQLSLLLLLLRWLLRGCRHDFYPSTAQSIATRIQTVQHDSTAQLAVLSI